MVFTVLLNHLLNFHKREIPYTKSVAWYKQCVQASFVQLSDRTSSRNRITFSHAGEFISVLILFVIIINCYFLWYTSLYCKKFSLFYKKFPVQRDIESFEKLKTRLHICWVIKYFYIIYFFFKLIKLINNVFFLYK